MVETWRMGERNETLHEAQAQRNVAGGGRGRGPDPKVDHQAGPQRQDRRRGQPGGPGQAAPDQSAATGRTAHRPVHGAAAGVAPDAVGPGEGVGGGGWATTSVRACG